MTLERRVSYLSGWLDIYKLKRMQAVACVGDGCCMNAAHARRSGGKVSSATCQFAPPRVRISCSGDLLRTVSLSYNMVHI